MASSSLRSPRLALALCLALPACTSAPPRPSAGELGPVRWSEGRVPSGEPRYADTFLAAAAADEVDDGGPAAGLSSLGGRSRLAITSPGPWYDRTAVLVDFDGPLDCAAARPVGVTAVWANDLGTIECLEVLEGRLVLDRSRCAEGALGVHVELRARHPLGELTDDPYYSEPTWIATTLTVVPDRLAAAPEWVTRFP